MRHIINFDLLFHIQQKGQIANAVNDHISSMNIMPTDQVVVMLVNELRPNINFILRTIQKQIPSVHFVLHSDYSTIVLDNTNVTFINFFILYAYNRYKITEQINDMDVPTLQYNLLTGKLNKPNRAQLLHRLYSANLLSNSAFSFPTTNNKADINRLRKLAPTDFDNFYAYCTKHAITDILPKFVSNTDNVDYSKLHKITKFSVIAESHFDTECFATEKTYRAIQYQKPFIIAGVSGVLAMLENYGFKTFAEYCVIPHYDSIQNNQKRLDAVVKNIKYFGEFIDANPKQISKDVQHNSALLAKINTKDLTICNELRIFLDKIVPTSSTISEADYNQYLAKYNSIDINQAIEDYEQIKDPSWPIIQHTDDFKSLPQYIKDELIERDKFLVFLT